MEEEKPPRQKWQRRNATLYDAVAGRITSSGFMKTGAAASEEHHNNQTAVPPEEALFRRKGAPIRYAEDDVYFQHRHLKPKQQLPDSDLLKAIHAYAADFYSRMGDEGKISQKSLDETALMAMGILLEEAGAKAIGKTGHHALMEDP